MPTRARTCWACWTLSRLRIETVPVSGRVRQARMRSSVVLPTPLAPSKATRSPCHTPRLIPRRTGFRVKLFLRSRICTMRISLGASGMAADNLLPSDVEGRGDESQDAINRVPTGAGAWLKGRPFISGTPPAHLHERAGGNPEMNVLPFNHSPAAVGTRFIASCDSSPRPSTSDGNKLSAAIPDAPNEIRMVQIRDLKKSFTLKPVLRGINLGVWQGERVALLGANGVGKTTLLRILACLTRPDTGTVSILSLDSVQQAQQVRALVGIVAHQPYLYPELTALENLLFFARMYA